MDVLWIRLSKRPEDGSAVLGRIQAGRLFIMLDCGAYWLREGRLRRAAVPWLPAFRQAIVELNLALSTRVREFTSWDDVKLLNVRVDRLKRWYEPGVLCIGDAAHAMSPVGGVGINLAIQHAVATANTLAVPLKTGPVAVELLPKVQRRREWPTQMMKAVQIFIQKRIISNVLAMQTRPARALCRGHQYLWLRRLPVRLIGTGFRPEHVQSPTRPASSLT
jgi:2-polyprenyl-6-methoxyphenol hydroxylase-like FAD-dependent oxidoreductase